MLSIEYSDLPAPRQHIRRYLNICLILKTGFGYFNFSITVTEKTLTQGLRKSMRRIGPVIKQLFTLVVSVWRVLPARHEARCGPYCFTFGSLSVSMITDLPALKRHNVTRGGFR
jgi:hypothetical protein